MKITITPLLCAALMLSQGCRSLIPSGKAPPPEPPPAYHAVFTDTPIIIDGRIDDAAWDRAAPIRSFRILGDPNPPLSQTEARILWDETYLYVAFEAQDKDVWGYLTERNDPTYREDVLEIFFKTDVREDAPYYNFEINALGTVYDAFSPRPNFAGGGHRWSRWNCEGLRIGVQVRGTLNNPADVDEGWDLEVAIPFASLPTLNGRPPRPGDVWAFHLARYDYSVHLPDNGREVSTCAPLTGRSFHGSQENWLRLVFDKDAE